MRVAGQGLRDMTRIAGSDAALWVDILSANAAPVAGVIESVIASLEDALARLRAGEGIEAVLEGGNAGRLRVPGKHGAAPTQYDIVAVMVADRPGELARLFQAAADAAVNLEDIRIEHVLGRPSGVIELAVQPEAGATLREALVGGGFDVRA